jgi:guanylate kinase
VENRQGVMLVVSAPSGTGKSTLTRRLVKEFPELTFSVSCTTRAIRPGEVDGRDYHFLSVEDFKSRIESGGFAEWAEVYGNYYGTPKKETLDLLNAGRDVLFDIDVQGAEQMKRNMSGGAYVFIFPPSLDALRRRLQGRGTDESGTVEKRLEIAPREIAKSSFFDYWVVNDELDAAYRDLRRVYLAERLRPACRPDLPDLVLGKT